MAREVAPGPVLVLAPHPDDEVIGMGGVLSMHAAAGAEVTVVYLTDGRGLGPAPGEMIRRRRAEAEAFGRDLAVGQVFWNKPDTRLTNDPDSVGRMADLLETVGPRSVYLPSFFDNHFDHFAANQILSDALRARPGRRPMVAGYEVWDHVPFPNYVVDITAHFPPQEGSARSLRDAAPDDGLRSAM